jgi:hypothetical protein
VGRWYILVPACFFLHILFTDKGGFGFKMLQKMGWKEGTGLGLAGDGSTEHIKVTANKDSIGTLHILLLGTNRYRSWC